jgi:two-component system cell cycle response regulator DivK
METSYKATVVVVEDEPLSLKLYSEILPLGGFRVVPSSDGVDIENIIARELPLAAILDLDLPLRTGQQIAESVRADPRIAATPLWAVSASVDTTRRLDLLAGGFDAAWPKPISIIGLIADLTRLLEGNTGPQSLPHPAGR